MSLNTLDKVFRRIFEEEVVCEELTVCWHAGEPLSLPISFYESAVEFCEKYRPSGSSVNHSFQTNGTLVNDRWCDFFRRINATVGLSLDGPKFLHDATRVYRSGRGSYEKSIRGASTLTRREIPFSAICVLTKQSLAYPDEIFEFFQKMGVRSIGFNIEEVEGIHESSSLEAKSNETQGRCWEFFSRIYDLAKNTAGDIYIREFNYNILNGGSIIQKQNQQTEPFHILTVAYNGDVSTFSPELCGHPSAKYHNFAFGNVHKDTFAEIYSSRLLQELHEEIKAGIEKCSDTCDYFPVCGGGAPSNKFFENASFSSTETLFCNLTRKIPTDVQLGKMEDEVFRIPSLKTG